MVACGAHMCEVTRMNARNPKFWAKVWQLQQTGSCLSSGIEEMEQIERAREVVQRAQSHLVHMTGGDKAEHAQKLMQCHSAKNKIKNRPEEGRKRRRVNEAVYTAFCEKDDVDLYTGMSDEIDKWRRFMAPLEPVENKPPPYVPPQKSEDIRRKIARKWQSGTAPLKDHSRLDFFVSHFCTPQTPQGVSPRSSRVPSWQESPPEPISRALSS